MEATHIEPCSASQPPVVETRDLTRWYRGDGAPVCALNGVTLTIRAGEFVALVGPSGSGKSTLLNLIGALDRPTSGDIRVGGTSLAQVRDLDRFRGQTIGFIFQVHNLIPTLTARENVEVPMFETTPRATQRHARASLLLERVGLLQRADFLPNQLSGGERQRVAIARALANQPAIVLADEPTGQLDSKTTADIMNLLTDLNRTQGTTLIVVTHNHEVSSAAQRLITIRDGMIQSDLAVSSPFQRAVLEFRRSALGQAILYSQELPPEWRAVAPQLRRILLTGMAEPNEEPRVHEQAPLR